MKKNQLTQGKERRVMYVENKDGDIDGVPARIGWVEISKSGLSTLLGSGLTFDIQSTAVVVNVKCKI